MGRPMGMHHGDCCGKISQLSRGTIENLNIVSFIKYSHSFENTFSLDSDFHTRTFDTITTQQQ